MAYALGTRRRLGARGGVAFSALEGPREVALGERHAFRPHGLLLISDRREAGNARALRADAHGEGTTIFTSPRRPGTAPRWWPIRAPATARSPGSSASRPDPARFNAP